MDNYNNNVYIINDWLGRIMLNEKEQIKFEQLLKIIAESDDMAVMQISNKAMELVNEINNL